MAQGSLRDFIFLLTDALELPMTTLMTRGAFLGEDERQVIREVMDGVNEAIKLATYHFAFEQGRKDEREHILSTVQAE